MVTRRGVCQVCGKQTSSGRYTVCIKCRWNRDRSFPTHKERRKNDHLKRAYGITLHIFREMWKKCSGKCGICNRAMILPVDVKSHKGAAAEVDHCHTTGIVRGLLCGECNRGLGMFKENIGTLKKAIEWLEIKQ